jgi:hypothetical protein
MLRDSEHFSMLRQAGISLHCSETHADVEVSSRGSILEPT